MKARRTTAADHGCSAASSPTPPFSQNGAGAVLLSTGEPVRAVARRRAAADA